MLFASLNRYHAFFLHLLAAACVIGCVAIFIFFVWYPGLLAYASGVSAIFLILILVDVILGPLITLIVFDTKKKELKRDLLIIFSLQLAALFYGVWILFSVRPVFVVFNSDRFDVVYANELTQERFDQATNKDFQSAPLWGPHFIGARLPSDSIQAAEIIKKAVMGGDDVQQMPEFYVPYQDIAKEVSGKARSLNELMGYNKDNLREVESLINQYSSISDKIGYVPLMAKVRDLTVVVNKETSDIIEMNKLQPVDNSFGVNALDLKKILKK